MWSSRTVLLEEEDGFGPAAGVFGWRSSNLKLHLLKKPVHNLVCFLFFFFFPPLSWNKLPAILCDVQVSRLPFTHSDLYSLPDSWGLHLRFCQWGRALQWSWQSYSGYLLHLQAAASPFVWTTENCIPGGCMCVGLPIIEKKKAAEAVSCLPNPCGSCAEELQNFAGWIWRLVAEQGVSLDGVCSY